MPGWFCAIIRMVRSRSRVGRCKSCNNLQLSYERSRLDLFRMFLVMQHRLRQLLLQRDLWIHPPMQLKCLHTRSPSPISLFARPGNCSVSARFQCDFLYQRLSRSEINRPRGKYRNASNRLLRRRMRPSKSKQLLLFQANIIFRKVRLSRKTSPSKNLTQEKQKQIFPEKNGFAQKVVFPF